MRNELRRQPLPPRVAVLLLLLIPLLALCLGWRPAAAGGGAPRPADLPEDLVEDLKALPSTENGCWLLGGTALTVFAQRWDDAAGSARTLDRRPLDTIAVVGNTWGDARFQIPLALVTWAAGSWGNDQDLACTGYDLSRAQLLSYGVVNLLKFTIDRQRPDGGRLSFPSGHTAAAFTTAGVLGRRHGGWLGASSLVLASLTGMGRVQDVRHWTSDVVAGAAIGWIIGRTVIDSRPAGDPAADADAPKLAFSYAVSF